MTTNDAAKSAHLAEVEAYWNRRATQQDENYAIVEQSQRTQKMRFEAFLLYHEVQGQSILDVGCGTGDLWQHLQARNFACDYMGVDISPEMVNHARSRFPQIRFETQNILTWQPNRRFDYTISIGIHNIKVEGGWELLRQITHRQFELCRRAAHLSILTDRYTGFAEHIQAWRAEDVLTMALEITPYVILRHDYLPNDFSVTLYREPLIDTRSDLLEWL